MRPTILLSLVASSLSNDVCTPFGSFNCEMKDLFTWECEDGYVASLGACRKEGSGDEFVPSFNCALDEHCTVSNLFVGFCDDGHKRDMWNLLDPCNSGDSPSPSSPLPY